MGAPVLQTASVGFPAQFASKIENVYSNQNGDNVTVTATAGDTLVAVAIGLKDYDPFDLLHGATSYPGYILGVNDYLQIPTISDNSSARVATITNIALTSNVVTITAANQFNAGDMVKITGVTTATFLNNQTLTVLSAGLSATQFEANFTHANYASAADTGTATDTSSGNDWTLAANINTFGADYIVSATPPTAPNPYPAVRWSLDGYFPSIMVWVANDVEAGTYQVNLNSMFQTGTAPNWQYGRPIFDAGVNFQVIRFTGMTAAASDGSSISASSSTANPAVGPAIVTTGTGDLVLAVALQKSANGLNIGTDGTLTAPGYVRVSNGKLVGSEAHYMVEWGIQTAAGSYVPAFANPLGYETIIAAIAIQHT